MGCALSLFVPSLSTAAAALCCAAGINTAVTRTVLATPVVLTTL